MCLNSKPKSEPKIEVMPIARVCGPPNCPRGFLKKGLSEVVYCCIKKRTQFQKAFEVVA
jgi:hypothetical protein